MEEKLPYWKIKYPPVIKQVVCWHCRKGNVTLYNIRDEDGKKTQDYTCGTCKVWGDPPIWNASRIVISPKVTPSTSEKNAEKMPGV